MNSKLQEYAKKLLDTGKKNNLINYKENNNSLAVLSPDFYTLLKKIEKNNELTIIEEKSDDFDYLSCSKKIKKDEILVYSKKNPKEALNNIIKKGELSISETGVNIIYLAFGFVKYFEPDDDTKYSAPLLLVPIKIEGENIFSNKKLISSYEDIIINPTLKFKFSLDFKINIPDFSENIENYISSLNDLFKPLNFMIDLSVSLSIFSFQKINMYNDLITNEEIILKNKNIQKILGIKGKFIEEEFIPKPLDFINTTSIVDADSSQVEAIIEAKNGKSFVLQGPPGTGKSQTITNIIAELLHDNKKILFVSEKMAALNVVFEKLKKCDLEDFCLELHSEKTNKLDVVRELFETFNKNQTVLTENAEDVFLNWEAGVFRLNDYEEMLHKKNDLVNKSLYEIFEEIYRYKNYNLLDYKTNRFNYSKMTDILDDFDLYERYSKALGKNYKLNSFYGINNSDAKLELLEDLKKMEELISNLNDIKDNINSFTNANISSFNDLEKFICLMDVIQKSYYFKPSVLISSVNKLNDIIPKLNDESLKIKEVKAKIDNDYTALIYELDHKMIYNDLKKYDSKFKRLFSKDYKRIINKCKECNKHGKKAKYLDLIKLFNNLNNYNLLNDKFDDSFILEYLNDNYLGPLSNYDLILKDIININLSYNYKLSYDFTRQYNLVLDDLIKNVSNYKEIISEYNIYFNAYLKRFDVKLNKSLDIPLKDFLTKITNSIYYFDSLDNYLNQLELVKKFKKNDLISYLDKMIEKNISSGDFKYVFLYNYYNTWANYIIDNNQYLKKLSRIDHDQMLEKFIKNDIKTFNINKSRIKEKCSHLRPSRLANTNEIVILKKEANKKRNLKSIRNLFSEIPNLVQLLKPCFLMSPLSVSTFLNSNLKFDCVIFDEASQIFPWDAICSIYRANQVIVVGDSKQMPPTDFFLSSNDDEESEVNDFDSILDICKSCFNEISLKWHYRSQNEALISFSNKYFYNDKLTTFPSLTNNNSGIEFKYVNGIYDRSARQNKAEAEYICDLVFENFKKYPNKSIGVVAFNKSQQDLIEKLIAKRRYQDIEFEEYFKKTNFEPFFVKNLESVQGDERDIIIFSISYGYDQDGKFILNFGPLNKTGGERRLNVAVTRAKSLIQIVSSIKSSDIDLSKTDSYGTKLLKAYLEYAELGENLLNKNVIEDINLPFEESICEFLREKGYAVDKNVGSSLYKIDIAVKKPNSDDYFFAIECDGETYHQSKNARDRDRLRQGVLEKMGWKFYRIWSIDWYKNNNIEKERLIDAIEDAKNNSDIEEYSLDEVYESSVVEDYKLFNEYVEADIMSLYKKNRYNFYKFIISILETESPLQYELLLKRIPFVFNREKVTSYVREEFEKAIIEYKSFGISFKNGFFYYGDKSPDLRIPSDNFKRKIDEISIDELSNGLKRLIEINKKIEIYELFDILLKHLKIKPNEEAYNILSNALESITNYVKITDGFVLLIE